MDNNYKISLVMPVFNEQEIIAETVEIFLAELADFCKDYELIAVDDGSTDDTGNLLRELEDKHKNNLKVITNKANLGSGRSLLEGFRSARFPFVVTNFADRPFDLKELKNVMPLFDKDVDFAVICRWDRSANSFYRRITSLVNYYLIRILFKVRVGDFQFVQIYRREILKDLNVKSARTFVPPEVIIKLLKRGFKMAEYRTAFHPRSKGQAKCGHPKVIFRTLFDMFRFWFILKRRGYC